MNADRTGPSGRGITRGDGARRGGNPGRPLKRAATESVSAVLGAAAAAVASAGAAAFSGRAGFRALLASATSSASAGPPGKAPFTGDTIMIMCLPSIDGGRSIFTRSPNSALMPSKIASA